ncbi:MAG: oxidoreductase domain protein [Verrucomicrobiales bacterium]|nr:oxidoreductase domain protein [Verrucomicrobiales bacterium]
MQRRRFLASAASLLAAPAFIPNLRAASPNGKVRHASFGAGGQAFADLQSFANSPNFELVAIADVDTSAFAAIKAKWPEVKCYQDWRELLEKESATLDSVNVSVPDHLHATMGAAVLHAGKHLYGQKPLTQNLRECRFITELAREKGVMTQMGIQISSAFTERFAVRLVQDGAVGKIKEVHTFSAKLWGDLDPVPQREDPIPASLNWDHWLAGAAARPYLKDYYHPGNWRKRRDFGTGTLGDMGCHMFSGWMRALALTSPISVKSSGPAPGKDNWALHGHVEYLFPGTQYTADKEVKVTWTDGDARPPQAVADLVGGKLPREGSLYIGTEGVLVCGHMSRPLIYPLEKGKGYKFPELEPRDHYVEFLDCVRNGGAKPSANFDYAGPLTEAVLLGCLSSIFPGKSLEWDAASLTFKNAPEANPFVGRTYRPGWEIPGLKA